MKSRVSYSTFSIVLSASVTIFLLALCLRSSKEVEMFYTLALLLVLLIIPTLFFAPLSIRADKDYITVVSPLKRHRIAMNDVESVRLFQPTMGAIRIFASGGYFGYWGIFREGDIGKYTGYYGKASDCFLIRTKSGRTYVLGCNKPADMVKFIEQSAADKD
ncbi:MAG: hypothetical protein HDS65_06630 [Bacteroidales bacterium]|nr:hypothetical protein [Bacteroidales bacterium]